VPFTADALPLVEPWFDDAETRRRLGDRTWPSMILRLAGSPPGEHRGRSVLEHRAWLVEMDNAPVGLVDAESYEDDTVGIALIVAPAYRSCSVGRRTLEAVAGQLVEEGMREIFGGVEVDNVASIRCMEAAGFTRRSNEPDAEGFLYFARKLHAAHGTYMGVPTDIEQAPP